MSWLLLVNFLCTRGTLELLSTNYLVIGMGLVTIKLSEKAHTELKVATARAGAKSYSEYLEKLFSKEGV